MVIVMMWWARTEIMARTAWTFLFSETIIAEDRLRPIRLERHFAGVSTLGAMRLEHLARTERLFTERWAIKTLFRKMRHEYFY